MVKSIKIEQFFPHRSGDLDILIPLRTTVYLANETEYVPWAAVSSELGFVSLMLQRDPMYGDYRVSTRDVHMKMMLRVFNVNIWRIMSLVGNSFVR